MFKIVSISVLSFLTLAGCGKFKDTIATSMDGHVVKCIEHTKYILLSSEAGLAITPAVGKDGLPLQCE